LKRPLSLTNSYVDDFDVLPADSDEGQLDYVHTLSYHKLNTHNIIQSCYMYYSADKEDEQLTADHPEATPDFLDTVSQNGIPRHELRLKDMLRISEQMHPSFQEGLVKNACLIAQVRVINNRTD
jgi:hypothetical protein